MDITKREIGEVVVIDLVGNLRTGDDYARSLHSMVNTASAMKK